MRRLHFILIHGHRVIDNEQLHEIMFNQCTIRKNYCLLFNRKRFYSVIIAQCKCETSWKCFSNFFLRDTKVYELQLDEIMHKIVVLLMKRK
jgi:hypothetical protein